MTKNPELQSSETHHCVGRSSVQEDVLSIALIRRLAATLGDDPATFQEGSVLPPGWHVVLFVPLETSGELGRDGHPRTGDFLPDLGLPRRMFAGRELEFHKPLRIGQLVRSHAEITAVVPKMGRSGRMAFVTVERRFEADGSLSILERQTIVYREAASPQATSASVAQLVDRDEWDWSIGFTPDMPLLFRYSAVTFNAHRVHYDADYARTQEGYPACLTNGGLTTLLMLGNARKNGWSDMTRCAVRNQRPLLVDRPVMIAGRRSANGKGGELVAIDDCGAIAVRADVGFS